MQVVSDGIFVGQQYMSKYSDNGHAPRCVRRNSDLNHLLLIASWLILSDALGFPGGIVMIKVLLEARQQYRGCVAPIQSPFGIRVVVFVTSTVPSDTRPGLDP